MPDYTITATNSGEEAGSRTIRIAGAITIPHISDIRGELLNSLDGADTIVLEVAGVNEIDVTGLQLLCSTHRSFVKKELQISIQGASAGVVHSAAESAGLLRTTCCVSNTRCACLWSGGEVL